MGIGIAEDALQEAADLFSPRQGLLSFSAFRDSDACLRARFCSFQSRGNDAAKQGEEDQAGRGHGDLVSSDANAGSPACDTGDTSGAFAVSFATIDDAGLTNCSVVNGIASPRCDYEVTVGTLQFAPGETSKSFSVAIVDDSYAEGNETFRVSLSNPSGATLGAPVTATVTIIDNDTVTGPNPIDNTNFFVRQQYLDFLMREPDPPGFAMWVSLLNNCAAGDTSCDRVHVSSSFYQSPEFQQRGYFVYRFYNVAFGRKPDYAEFVPDLASISGFLTDPDLEAAKLRFIADFMTRPAFASQYNSLSNSAYVDALLNTARVGLSNRQMLIDSLNNKTVTRAQVLRQVAESGEVYQKRAKSADSKTLLSLVLGDVDQPMDA